MGMIGNETVVAVGRAMNSLNRTKYSTIFCYVDLVMEISNPTTVSR